MTEQDYDAIKNAIKIIQTTPGVTKVEGDKWSVYSVGQVIRIDIKK